MTTHFPSVVVWCRCCVVIDRRVINDTTRPSTYSTNCTRMHVRTLDGLLGELDDVGDLGRHGDVPEEAQVRGPVLRGEELFGGVG